MSQPANKVFGAGRFFGVNNVTNPTPMRAVATQDMSIDFKRTVKELYGENQFALEVAGGEISVTGKVTMGGVNARIISDLFFGGTGSAAGNIIEADKEAGTVPGSTAYTIQTANHTTWTTDLGVMYASGLTPLVRVAAGSEAAGKYSVAAGVYTFAAADANKAVLISYLYTNAAGSGETVTMANQPMGQQTGFTAVMNFYYGTQQNIVTLNNCIASDTGIGTKMGDFAKPTLGFTAATDTTDTLGTICFALPV